MQETDIDIDIGPDTDVSHRPLLFKKVSNICIVRFVRFAAEHLVSSFPVPAPSLRPFLTYLREHQT